MKPRNFTSLTETIDSPFMFRERGDKEGERLRLKETMQDLETEIKSLQVEHQREVRSKNCCRERSETIRCL